MDKIITAEQLQKLAEFFKETVMPNRLYEVRKNAMEILDILGIKIELR